jgi:hypothetical protein
MKPALTARRFGRMVAAWLLVADDSGPFTPRCRSQTAVVEEY